LASAVHEINSPLEALADLLYLVESDSGLSERSREYLSLAEAELRRISRIAQNVMKQFRTREAATQADVAELLASVLELQSAKLRATGISVVQHHCDDATLLVFPGLMRQVFNNLLRNAIDAMPRGGTLRARIRHAHEWLGWTRTGLRITVADNGKGIPAEVLPRVKEPFFTTKGAAGNGMGLAVVQEIVVQHFGALKIRSCNTPGRAGTVITMFIPSGLGRT